MTGNAPEHWRPSTGPSNWFDVRHPPGWDSQSDGNILNLTSSDGRITVTLHCVWLDDPSSQLDEHVMHLEKIFPVRRGVHGIDPLPIDDRNFGLEGEAVLGPETPWWKRAITKSEWRRWRVWAVRHQSLCLIAVYLQDEEFDPEANTLVAMILGSLEFAEPLALPPSIFAERVLETARRDFPDHQCVLDDNLQLRLGESTINLFNLYRTYANGPAHFDEIVKPALSTLVEVQNWGKSRLNPTLDTVRGRIMPMLYPEEVWQKQFGDFAAQPWIADLVILYVVDESDAYWYIRNDLLEEWHLTTDELHILALENLDSYFADNPMEFMLSGAENGPKLLLPHRADAYNTARLLSVSFHASMQEVLGREFIVGVPNRDFFVAVSLGSDEMIDQIQRKVVEDFGRMDHPLCDRLLLVSSDGVSEYFETGE